MCINGNSYLYLHIHVVVMSMQMLNIVCAGAHTVYSLMVEACLTHDSCVCL